MNLVTFLKSYVTSPEVIELTFTYQLFSNKFKKIIPTLPIIILVKHCYLNILKALIKKQYEKIKNY